MAPVDPGAMNWSVRGDPASGKEPAVVHTGALVSPFHGEPAADIAAH